MNEPRHAEPKLAAAASWAVLAASFGLSASTWVALAELAGFAGHVTVYGATLTLALLMPIAVDGYVVTALVLWMAPVPDRVARFARANTYAAAGVGVAAQAAYHALLVWSATGVVWRAVMAAVVGALPPGVAALAVHMRALIRRESSRRSSVVEREPARPPTEPASAARVPVTRAGKDARAAVDELLPVTGVGFGAVEPPAWSTTLVTTPAVRPSAAVTAVFIAPPEDITEDVDDEADIADEDLDDAEMSAPVSGPPAARRSAEETRRLASALLSDPDLTRQQVADTLGITVRHLRRVLPGERTSPAGTGVNGEVPDMVTAS